MFFLLNLILSFPGSQWMWLLNYLPGSSWKSRCLRSFRGDSFSRMIMLTFLVQENGIKILVKRRDFYNKIRHQRNDAEVHELRELRDMKYNNWLHNNMDHHKKFDDLHRGRETRRLLLMIVWLDWTREMLLFLSLSFSLCLLQTEVTLNGIYKSRLHDGLLVSSLLLLFIKSFVCKDLSSSLFLISL